MNWFKSSTAEQQKKNAWAAWHDLARTVEQDGHSIVVQAYCPNPSATTAEIDAATSDLRQNWLAMQGVNPYVREMD